MTLNILDFTLPAAQMKTLKAEMLLFKWRQWQCAGCRANQFGGIFIAAVNWMCYGAITHTQRAFPTRSVWDAFFSIHVYGLRTCVRDALFLVGTSLVQWS